MTIVPFLTHSGGLRIAVRPLSRLVRWFRGPAPQAPIEPTEVTRLAQILNQYTRDMDRVRDNIRRDSDEIMKGQHR